MLNREFLKETTLFKDLTEEELLEILLIGHMQSYEPDKVIFKEGDPGDTLYLIVKGTVRISKMDRGNEEALAILEEKAFFGEMTLFDNATRSAFAIAHGRCSLFAISADALCNLFEANSLIGYKFLWAFCNTLTSRLRTANEKMQVIMSLANSGF